MQRRSAVVFGIGIMILIILRQTIAIIGEIAKQLNQQIAQCTEIQQRVWCECRI